MKPVFRVAFLIVALASTLHCGKSPTEPLGGNVSIPTHTPIPRPPTPIPTPAPGSLAGTWTGTFEDGTCSESIRADLGHNGDNVDADFTTHCTRPNGDFMELVGTLHGSTLNATLYAGNDSTFATLEGTASSTSIDLAGHASNGPVSLRLSR
jgi:hypothetical protein